LISFAKPVSPPSSKRVSPVAVGVAADDEGVNLEFVVAE